MVGFEATAGGDLAATVTCSLSLVPRPERDGAWAVLTSGEDRWYSVSGAGVEIGWAGCFVRVRGEVDRTNAHLLSAVLDLAAARGHGVTVDLSELLFIDLGGTRVLTDLAASIGPRHRLTVLSPPPMFRRIVDATGLALPGRIVWRSM